MDDGLTKSTIQEMEKEILFLETLIEKSNRKDKIKLIEEQNKLKKVINHDLSKGKFGILNG